MIYPFECSCGNTKEVIRVASEAHLPETCDCGVEMERVWTIPEVNVPFTQSYYNHGLGCKVSNQHDVKEAIKRIGGDQTREVWRKDEYGKSYKETVKVPGQKLIEVGNEKKAMNKIKPKRQSYKLPREVMAQIG